MNEPKSDQLDDDQLDARLDQLDDQLDKLAARLDRHRESFDRKPAASRTDGGIFRAAERRLRESINRHTAIGGI